MHELFASHTLKWGPAPLLRRLVFEPVPWHPRAGAECLSPDLYSQPGLQRWIQGEIKSIYTDQGTALAMIK